MTSISQPRASSEAWQVAPVLGGVCCDFLISPEMVFTAPPSDQCVPVSAPLLRLCCCSARRRLCGPRRPLDWVPTPARPHQDGKKTQVSEGEETHPGLPCWPRAESCINYGVRALPVQGAGQGAGEGQKGILAEREQIPK